MSDRKVFNVVVYLDIEDEPSRVRLLVQVESTEASDEDEAEVYAVKLAAKLRLMHYYNGTEAFEAGAHMWPQGGAHGS
jgi:hypothetical protein